MKTSNSTQDTLSQSLLFSLDGVPPMKEALPLALQHVVAMIVGCVTPSIIVANTAGLADDEKVILIQSALIVSALSTLLQLYGLGKKDGFHLGSRLPVIMGISFAYVASMQAIAESGRIGISYILGAQIFGGAIAFLIGLCIDKIRVLFPPIVTGTVIFTIGVSLYPTAVKYMAGGAGSENYGSWQNWLVAIITLAVVTFLNQYTKGFLKLASILIGMIVGYLIAICFGMVDFSSLATASWFSMPKPMHFGIQFEPSSCISIGLLFAINSIQAIGDFTATTTGSMRRYPTDSELKSAILGYGFTNAVGALLNGLPTATYSQNVGIVTTTKVINRSIMGITSIILLVAGFVPKFSGLLTTIPQCVLGGATVSVFASIAMTGMRLITAQEMSFRNTSIVGLSVALGVGISIVPEVFQAFPPIITTIFAKTPVVIATIMAVFLNLIFPKGE